MWKIVCVCLVLLFTLGSAQVTRVNSDQNSAPLTVEAAVSPRVMLYEELGLDSLLAFPAFDMAMDGFEDLDAPNKRIFTIIDFTKPSSEKRMWVIDMEERKILFHTVVSHGRNSGDLYARSFSNIHGSFQSSLGFYRTANTYQGGNGYSMVLEGLEPGINDQAKARAVVVHGADYANESFISRTGRLGRSYGCPALPRSVNKPIIDTIKDGSLLFIYAENEEYLAQSKVVRPQLASTKLAAS